VTVLAHGWERRAAAAGLVALWSAGAALGLVEWTRPEGTPLRASVVQANIQPSMKWDPDALVPVLQAHLELTRELLQGSDLIVWPETAVPAFLDEVRDGLIDPLSQTAREAGTTIVLGVPYRELDTGRYYNGLLSIGAGEDLYAKRHLVPFGEFMPFKTWLGPLVKMFEVPMSDFSRGARGDSLLDVGGYQAGASICYEDAFAEEVIQALPAAAYLINVSNDAWFGDSVAPHQHQQMARMRAVETGRDLIRATNTGISALIDSRGAITSRVPQFEAVVLRGEVTPRTGMTPYARSGNWPVVVGAILTLAGVGLRRRRARSGLPRSAGRAVSRPAP